MAGKIISVIILSFNTKEITKKCLRSVLEAKNHLERTSEYKIEVIVVDNASTDGSAEMVASDFSWVKLIKNVQNVGFASGNNMAIRESKGDYLLLLNSDAFLEKDSLSKSISFIETNPEVSIFACKLKNKDGSLQPSAGTLPNPINMIFWLMGIDELPIIRNIVGPIHPAYEGYFASQKNVGWVMGAFLFLKRGVFDKTQGFDEHFFMYMEEVEWCRRIHNAGYEVIYVPSFAIAHLGRASGGFDTKGPIVKELQSLEYYTKKHFGSLMWMAIMPVMYVGIFLRMISFYIIGNKEKSKIYRAILVRDY